MIGSKTNKTNRPPNYKLLAVEIFCSRISETSLLKSFHIQLLEDQIKVSLNQGKVENLIIFYSKEKLETFEELKADSTSNVDSLLEKYSFNKRESFKKLNFNEKIAVLYIDCQTSEKYNTLSLFERDLNCLKQQEAEKKLVLFNGVKEAIIRQAFQQKVSGFSEEKVFPAIIGEEAFEELLIQINIEFGLDYVCSSENSDSLEFLEVCLSNSCENLRRELQPFSKRSKTIRNVGSLCGVEDEFSLLWADMLTGIPGVSQEIAFAISKAYKSPASLIKAYFDFPIENRPLMLQDIPVIRPFNSEMKIKRLGPKLSRKIFTVFLSTDPSTSI